MYVLLIRYLRQLYKTNLEIKKQPQPPVKCPADPNNIEIINPKIAPNVLVNKAPPINVKINPGKPDIIQNVNKI